jgi:hypothetical protein
MVEFFVYVFENNKKKEAYWKLLFLFIIIL